MALVDPRDMLNNFCFHVYAQKSLFIGENGNGFFLTSSSSSLPYPVSLPIIELALVDPRDMLNNFCFHVYAYNSLFIGENDNEFFWTSSAAPAPVTLEFIELVPS